MASRLLYGVSVTPIYTHAAGEGVTTDVIAADYNKTFSSGTLAVEWAYFK